MTDSVTKSDDGLGLKADLKDEISGVVLQLTLSSVLKDGSILRMHIDEPSSERRRYEAKEALADDIAFSKLKLVESGASGFTASFGDKDKVVVNANPFRIDLYKGDRLVMSGNQRGLLKFEYFRHQGEGEVSYLAQLMNVNLN